MTEHDNLVDRALRADAEAARARIRAATMPDLEALAGRVAALEATVGRLVQAEEDFMSAVRTDTFRAGFKVESVRLTHLPTGVMVEAPTRPEAVAKLNRALERRAERHASWAGGVPGAA